MDIEKQTEQPKGIQYHCPGGGPAVIAPLNGAVSIKEGIVKSLSRTWTRFASKANLKRAEIDGNLKGPQNLRESQTCNERRPNKIVKIETQEVVIELEIEAD